MSIYYGKALVASGNYNFVTYNDLSDYVKKSEFENFVTRDELENYVTHDDLQNYVTHDDLQNYVTKNDLSDYVTYSVYNSEIKNIWNEINTLNQKVKPGGKSQLEKCTLTGDSFIGFSESTFTPSWNMEIKVSFAESMKQRKSTSNNVYVCLYDNGHIQYRVAGPGSDNKSAKFHILLIVDVDNQKIQIRAPSEDTATITIKSFQFNYDVPYIFKIYQTSEDSVTTLNCDVFYENGTLIVSGSRSYQYLTGFRDKINYILGNDTYHNFIGCFYYCKLYPHDTNFSSCDHMISPYYNGNVGACGLWDGVTESSEGIYIHGSIQYT